MKRSNIVPFDVDIDQRTLTFASSECVNMNFNFSIGSLDAVPQYRAVSLNSAKDLQERQ